MERGPKFTIPANGETIVTIPKSGKNIFKISNFFIKGAENLEVTLDLLCG